MVTDVPTFFTTLNVAGQSKTVRDYADGAPKWLRDLDQEIDGLADTHRWRHGDPAEELFGEMRLQEDTFMPKPGITCPLRHRSATWCPAQFVTSKSRPSPISCRCALQEQTFHGHNNRQSSVRLAIEIGSREGVRAAKNRSSIHHDFRWLSDPGCVL